MIGYLQGKVVSADEKSAIVLASGVGYRVFMTPEGLTLLSGKSGEEVSLWVHTAVRETAIDLFGFEEKGDRDFFELLITVSGIGPRSALTILGSADRETLLQAISSKETAYLTKISGIGRKTAEKIVLELEGKVAPREKVPLVSGEGDVLEALKSLGYGEREAREAIKKIPKEIPGISDRVREALKLLSQN